VHVLVDILIKFLITLRVRFLKCSNNTFWRIHSINMEYSFLEKKVWIHNVQTLYLKLYLKVPY